MSDFQKAKQYVFNLLGSDLSRHFIYHDLSHTLDVYKASTRLGEMAQLSEHELLLLQTAALYHDVGLIYTLVGHEDKGVEIIKEVLPDFGYSTKDIELISQMIAATRLPQTPKSKLDELICDADLDYLGRDDFFLQASKLHLEWNRMKIQEMTFDEWIAVEKEFLNSHHYYSPEAKALHDIGKKENLMQLNNICNKVK